MNLDNQSAPVSKKMLWAGRIMSALPVLMFLMGAVMSLTKPAFVLEGLVKMGYPESLAVPLGLVELGCTIIYIIPRTSVLGAILLTGYLGGAVATHVRVEEAFFLPIVFGVLVWGGLFLREPRLRALIPLKR
ncbi:MAG: DoxX family protein [Candidatus Hydrogenedentes bacterium]|nr:DoxX family protein [Candidatus Hydrogenedentota bacterium]